MVQPRHVSGHDCILGGPTSVNGTENQTATGESDES